MRKVRCEIVTVHAYSYTLSWCIHSSLCTDLDQYLYHNEFSFLLHLVKLTDVLTFFTGADEIPAGGYTQKPTPFFNNEGVLHTASTCAQHLILPTQFHEDFDQFKDI